MLVTHTTWPPSQFGTIMRFTVASFVLLVSAAHAFTTAPVQPRHMRSLLLNGRSRGAEDDGDCAVRNVGLVPQDKPIVFGGDQTDEYMERYKDKIAIGHYIPAAVAAVALYPTIMNALGQ